MRFLSRSRSGRAIRYADRRLQAIIIVALRTTYPRHLRHLWALLQEHPGKDLVNAESRVHDGHDNSI